MDCRLKHFGHVSKDKIRYWKVGLGPVQNCLNQPKLFWSWSKSIKHFLAKNFMCHSWTSSLKIIIFLFSSHKGQLISKGIFGVIVSTLKPMNCFKVFCPSLSQKPFKIFVVFFGPNDDIQNVLLKLTDHLSKLPDFITKS